jgi:hypothetical protein
MATDHIRYDVLAQAALRGVVRTVLADVAKKGLPGEHHFKITFNTAAPGVRLSERMRAQYPQTMTVVMQHQFWDLRVDDAGFEVGLSFGGVPERLAVPFDAVTAFYDPAVQFGFQFETLDANAPVVAAGSQAAPVIERPAPLLQEVGKTDTQKIVAQKAEELPDPEGSPSTDPVPPTRPDGGAGAEVVRLDRFRKK